MSADRESCEMDLMWAYEVEHVWGELVEEPEIGGIVLTKDDRGDEWKYTDRRGGFFCVRYKEGRWVLIQSSTSLDEECRN